VPSAHIHDRRVATEVVAGDDRPTANSETLVIA
jgi:hypothetical protein